MIINNVELEDLDIFDADVAEKCQQVFSKVAEESNKIEKSEDTAAQIIRKECALIFECFNELFGEGTDKKVFGDKTNILVCMKVFEELIEKVSEQKKELDKVTLKYSSNRAKRRGKV